MDQTLAHRIIPVFRLWFDSPLLFRESFDSPNPQGSWSHDWMVIWFCIAMVPWFGGHSSFPAPIAIDLSTIRASKLWRVVPLKPTNNDLNTGTWFAFRGTTQRASRLALNLQFRSASSPTSAVWQNPKIDYGLRSLSRPILTTKILIFVWSRKLISRLICRTL